jgi:hypothetical protein
LEPEVLVCTNCFRELPTKCFSFPHTTCADCKANRRTEKAEEKLQEQAKAVMVKVLDENFVPTANSAAMIDVVNEIYTCFGGPRSFAKRFHEHVEAVLERKPATAAGGQLLLQFMRLHLKLEENVERQDAAELTDEQLRREQELELLKFYVDAANDPVKRRTIERLLGLQGFKLVGMTPAEILEPNDTNNTTSDRSEEGSGAA